jgi:hypothetical protein
VEMEALKKGLVEEEVKVEVKMKKKGLVEEEVKVKKKKMMVKVN